MRLVKDVNKPDGLVAQGLERHCLAGSLESCFHLASLRADSNLEKLCTEGLADACPIPADKVSDAALEADCLKREVGACQRLLSRVGPSAVQTFSRALLEAGCADGRAAFCFGLSRHLRATEPARAKTLAWRSCLSGFSTACAESDEGEARCARGSDAACRSFEWAETDDDSTKASRLKLFERACGSGASEVCRFLANKRLGPPQRLLDIACSREATCEAVMTPTIAAAACAGGKGRARDKGCAALLWSAGRGFGEGSKEIDPGAEPWAKERCAKTPADEGCTTYARALERTGRVIEATRVKSAATGERVESLDSLDRCLSERRTRDDCARAVLWLDGLDLEIAPAERATVNEVFSRGCELGEASVCEKAAERLDGQPDEARRLYQRACDLGATSACRFAASLTQAKKRCELGHCAAWARAFTDLDVELSLLEKTCAAGEKEDCKVWARRVEEKPSRFLQVCTERGAGFCAKEQQALVAPLFKACSRQDGAACGKLLASLTVRGQVDDPPLTVWAQRACDAKDAHGCFLLATWDEGNATAAETACALDHERACELSARRLWETAQRAEGGERSKNLETPGLKRARALALKACQLESSTGCELAGDFFESGVGGPADALESSRLNEKARQLRNKKW